MSIEPGERFFTLDDAYRYCEYITRNHYENFPVASLLMPARLRKHVCAIYAYARTADDFADEPGMAPDDRLEALQDWETELDACYQGIAQQPIFIALMDTVERFRIPQEPLRNLLAAFRQDVTVNRYATFDDLRRYCRNSADPVGRLILMLSGYRDEELFGFSDNICTALQLANFWQDLSIDLDKNRLYLPLEDVKRLGLTETELFARRHTDAIGALIAFEVERTERMFQEGKPLLAAVDGGLRMELKLVWNGGRTILEKIRKIHYRVVEQRPALTAGDKARIFLHSLVRHHG